MNPAPPVALLKTSQSLGDKQRRTFSKRDGRGTLGKRPPRTARSHSRPDRDVLVETIVEQICACGCKAVYQVIASLQARRIPDEMAELSSIECDRVLMELESIMAVYAENGSACLLGDS